MFPNEQEQQQMSFEQFPNPAMEPLYVGSFWEDMSLFGSNMNATEAAGAKNPWEEFLIYSRPVCRLPYLQREHVMTEAFASHPRRTTLMRLPQVTRQNAVLTVNY